MPAKIHKSSFALFKEQDILYHLDFYSKTNDVSIFWVESIWKLIYCPEFT